MPTKGRLPTEEQRAAHEVLVEDLDIQLSRLPSGGLSTHEISVQEQKEAALIIATIARYFERSSWPVKALTTIIAGLERVMGLPQWEAVGETTQLRYEELLFKLKGELNAAADD